MELVFLGTGAGVPAKQRNVSSIALILPENKGDMWLFDCGEATQHQILKTKIKLPKITTIFISHLHGDHIFGLPGLLGSRGFQGGESPLTIYGPKGIKRFIDETLSLSGTHLRYSLDVVEIEDGMAFAVNDINVTVKQLDHRIASFGYRIAESDRPGELLVDKLKEQGVLPGPIYKQFKENPEVTLPDGRTFISGDFLGPVKPGKKLAVLGDTRPCEAGMELAKQVDVLVHEATFMADNAEAANQFYHSTAKEAATAARHAGVDTLILTHISSRYQDVEESLIEEARHVFEKTHLAEDFWSYSF